ALLQPGGLLDLLLADGLSPAEFDVGQHGHLTDGEREDELATLGWRLLVVDLHVREPLLPHQGLEVGVDLLLVERLADLAEQLLLDLIGGDRGIPLEPDLGDGPLGEPVDLRASRWYGPGDEEQEVGRDGDAADGAWRRRSGVARRPSESTH